MILIFLYSSFTEKKKKREKSPWYFRNKVSRATLLFFSGSEEQRLFRAFWTVKAGNLQ